VIGLIQRVTRAQVSINNQIISSIGHGIMALIGIEKTDTKQSADKLLHRILRYRIFADTTGKMNLGLKNVNGDLLLIPQFTLHADTKKGLRPSFSNSAPPDLGRELFDYLVREAIACHSKVETGSFAADKQVSLTNDGPVTFWLQV
jgi:D-tyrosyl-tRNA(Tyr) deacylase